MPVLIASQPWLGALVARAEGSAGDEAQPNEANRRADERGQK
ncbi:MAG: hypothetical protein AB7Q42_11080 [Acidimicrobiia bacterium]